MSVEDQDRIRAAATLAKRFSHCDNAGTAEGSPFGQQSDGRIEAVSRAGMTNSRNVLFEYAFQIWFLARAATDMPLSPSWSEICVRLALTMLAGAIIGFNRGARGHAAGFRTTILVCLAASVAMIQTNILLSLSGKTQQSFAVMDLMRLPLGILTGVGFIGGGTILTKGDAVAGVTTAATLWLVTVIGLCLGGGQLGLGISATALALLILCVLKWLETNLSQVRHACLDVVVEHGGPVDDDLRAALL